MKKYLLILSVVITIILSSCCDSKTINGITYEPYGLLNKEKKCDAIEYITPIEPVIAGIVFCEIIVPPVYIFSYNMYEPYKLKDKSKK